MPDTHARRMTVAEFLEWDDGTEVRYELIDGQPVAMTPPAPIHARIAGRLAVAIGKRLPRPCDVVTEPGVRLRAQTDTHTYYQADLGVTCQPETPGPGETFDLALIVEVLSPSNRRRDILTKLDLYRALPGLMDILLVASDRRRVQHWTRQAGSWFLQDIIGAGTVRLPALGIEVPLDEIYAGLGLE